MVIYRYQVDTFKKVKSFFFLFQNFNMFNNKIYKDIEVMS